MRVRLELDFLYCSNGRQLRYSESRVTVRSLFFSWQWKMRERLE